jgi:hypothetical protein
MIEDGDAENHNDSSDLSFDAEEVRPTRTASRSRSQSNTASGKFNSPKLSPKRDNYMVTSDNEINTSDDLLDAVESAHETRNANATPPQPFTVCGFIHKQAFDFYKTILLPQYFLLFNLLCVLQAVPALYYYISFFGRDFIMPHSSGMPQVWCATIGSIGATIVTLALGPLPPGLITRPFAIAVILWKLIITIFVLIATINLAVLGDMHSLTWGVICVFSSTGAGVVLLYLGLNLERLKAEQVAKYGAPTDSNTSLSDGDEAGLEMVTVYDTNRGAELATG